jgi:hypothetical protein
VTRGDPVSDFDGLGLGLDLVSSALFPNMFEHLQICLRSYDYNFCFLPTYRARIQGEEDTEAYVQRLLIAPALKAKMCAMTVTTIAS